MAATESIILRLQTFRKSLTAGEMADLPRRHCIAEIFGYISRIAANHSFLSTTSRGFPKRQRMTPCIPLGTTSLFGLFIRHPSAHPVDYPGCETAEYDFLLPIFQPENNAPASSRS